jgi:hypothetical protein
MRTHLFLAASALIALTAVSSPRITGVAPASTGPSPTPQVLTVSGEGFMAGLSLTVTTPGGGSRLFKDADIQSRSDSSFQISVALPVTGTYSLVVTNPDGGMSAPFALSVAAARLATAEAPPIIDAVTPSKTTARPDAQALRVDGRRFVPGLTVYVTDPTGQVVNVSGNDVADMTPSGFRVSVVLGMEGQYTLNVKNPDGELSNACSVTVTKMLRSSGPVPSRR